MSRKSKNTRRQHILCRCPMALELRYTAEYGPVLVQVGLEWDDPEVVLVQLDPRGSIARTTGVSRALYSKHCPACGTSQR